MNPVELMETYEALGEIIERYKGSSFNPSEWENRRFNLAIAQALQLVILQLDSLNRKMK